MTVYIPSPLRSYTGEKAEVSAQGTNLFEVVADLNQQYPGFRFRIIDEQDKIRTHIKIFVNQQQMNSLAVSIHPPIRSTLSAL